MSRCLQLSNGAAKIDTIATCYYIYNIYTIYHIYVYIYITLEEDINKANVAKLKQLVNLGNGHRSAEFTILLTSKFEIFQNKTLGKKLGEKKKKTGKKNK